MESKVNAGEFATWIEELTRTMKGVSKGNVPCGDCAGCCTSGLEKRHFLLGYDEKGHCPMFKTDKCSIYESRPEICRQYDCRVLAASKIEISDESQEITAQVNSWEFEFTSAKRIELGNAVELAVSFLTNYANKFSTGFTSPMSAQIAEMGIRVHALLGIETPRSV